MYPRFVHRAKIRTNIKIFKLKFVIFKAVEISVYGIGVSSQCVTFLQLMVDGVNGVTGNVRNSASREKQWREHARAIIQHLPITELTV